MVAHSPPLGFWRNLAPRGHFDVRLKPDLRNRSCLSRCQLPRRQVQAPEGSQGSDHIPFACRRDTVTLSCCSTYRLCNYHNSCRTKSYSNCRNPYRSTLYTRPWVVRVRPPRQLLHLALTGGLFPCSGSGLGTWSSLAYGLPLQTYEARVNDGTSSLRAASVALWGPRVNP
jgi:hypothetical protein